MRALWHPDPGGLALSAGAAVAPVTHVFSANTFRRSKPRRAEKDATDWLAQAASQVIATSAGEYDRLRKLNPAAARNLSRQMRNAQRNLAAFDGIGFESEELPIRGMRQLVVGDYLMDYEVAGNEIHVLAIRHGRQLPPDVPLDDDYDFEAD